MRVALVGLGYIADLHYQAVRKSGAYEAALRELGAGNAVCAACVCPKHVAPNDTGLRARVRAALARAIVASSERSGIPA